MRRHSRPNPYILPTADIENALLSTPRDTQLKLASLLNLSEADWDALDTPKKVLHILRFQNTAPLVSMMVHVARTHEDLDRLTTPVTALNGFTENELSVTQKTSELDA